MSETARTGTTWDLTVRNVAVGRTAVTGTTTGATVTYAATLDGAPYLSGPMVWEGYGYDRAWVARFALPPTPGILTAVATVNATSDGAPVTGRSSPISVEVI